MTNYIIGFIFGLFACYFYSWFTKEDKIEKGESVNGIKKNKETNKEVTNNKFQIQQTNKIIENLERELKYLEEKKMKLYKSISNIKKLGKKKKNI
mgnify:CR=1 FL=1